MVGVQGLEGYRVWAFAFLVFRSSGLLGFELLRRFRAFGCRFFRYTLSLKP